MISSLLSFSQQTPKEETSNDLKVISLEFSVGAGVNIGIVSEDKNSNSIFGKKSEDRNLSNITRIYYSAVTLTSSEIFIKDIDGSGFGIEYG